MTARNLAALAVLAVCVAGLSTPPSAIAANVAHPRVVSEDPANFTPRVVPDEIARPRVNAIAQLGNKMFAGGLFHTIADKTGQHFARSNFVVFDANTGAVSAGAPRFDGEVLAVESDGTSVYVGGEFSTVDGVVRKKLVKLNADGSVNTRFNARFAGGRVADLHMYRGAAGTMLFVGGSIGGKLVALDPATGENTGYLDLAIENQIPNSFGALTLHNFAINPAGTKLVAVGNFMTVRGQSRHRAFMANLGPGGASLAPWYYPEFEKKCNVQTPRRLAYLTDVDFAPDGSYFVIVATGHNPLAGDWGKTVCDAAARFDTGSTTPSWINYTGGDTIWSVSVTGAAVYVQGHFQWLDNKFGVGDQPAPTAVRRLGIGAIDPDSGQALPWNPGKPAKQGGKQLLATTDGLWVVSDSRRFSGEPRYGIALAPLV